MCLVLQLGFGARAAEIYTKQGTWVDTMVGARAALAATGLPGPEQATASQQVWFRLKEDFPVQWDWALQDAGNEFGQWLSATGAPGFERRMIEKAVGELGDLGRALR